jgi:hypothetical protein
MRSKLLCCLLSVMTALPSEVKADVELVINKHGAFKIDTSSNPPTVTPIPIDRIVIDTNAKDPGSPNPPDDPNPQPPTDTLTQKIADLSKIHLKSEKEAKAVMATLGTLRDLVDKGAVTEAQLDAAIQASIPVVATQLNAGTRLTEFYKAVKSAAGIVNKDTISKTISAIAFSWKIDSSTLTLKLRAAGERLDEGGTVGAAAEAVTGTQAEALDIATILVIIQAIIELLKTLGIIGG